MEEGFWLHPDVCEDILRTQHADMLEDQDRNEKYRKVIQKVVPRASGIVLDIGTGSGLLAILAAKAGAKQVFACERNQGMASVATQVVKDNGLEDVITIIPKMSTTMTIGPTGDLPEKVSILIHEIVDSELIGEGILSTQLHAINQLLMPSFINIPHSATIYGTIVETEKLWKFHSMDQKENFLGISLVEGPCPGSQLRWQIAIDEVPEDIWRPLTDPFEIFTWTFSHGTPTTGTRQVSPHTISGGFGHGLLLWWSLQLDTEGEFVLDTKPKKWNLEKPWRNHWQQCIYFFGEPLRIGNEGELVSINANHNHIRLWFEASMTPLEKPVKVSSPPFCSCDMHQLLGRPRIAALNDFQRNKAYEIAISRALETLKKTNGEWVCLGDGSFVGLMAARSEVRGVSVENNSVWRKIAANQAKQNGLHDKITFVRNINDLGNRNVELVIAEPFYEGAQRDFEWRQILMFWYEKSQLSMRYSSIVNVIPQAASICGMAVQFKHLPKNLYQVHVEGVNLDALNTVLSCVKPMFIHSLWEYEWVPLSSAFCVFDFDFKQSTHGQAHEQPVILTNGTLHGVVLWVNYHLDSEITISSEPVPGGEPSWGNHGLFSFEELVEVHPGQHLVTEANFDEFDDKISFNFVLES